MGQFSPARTPGRSSIFTFWRALRANFLFMVVFFHRSGARSRRGGSAAIEFALVGPLLIMMLVGMVVYGGWMWLAQSVQTLATESARAAVGGRRTECCGTDQPGAGFHRCRSGGRRGARARSSHSRRGQRRGCDPRPYRVRRQRPSGDDDVRPSALAALGHRADGHRADRRVLRCAGVRSPRTSEAGSRSWRPRRAACSAFWRP